MRTLTLIAVLLLLILAPRHDPPCIAIVSAFAAEQAALRARLTDTRAHTFGLFTYTSGQLNGRDVLLFVSGESLVNAAMHTQHALDHFDVSQVVMVGIGGALDPTLQVGDVIIPQGWALYQEGVYLLESADGTLTRPDWLASDTPECGGLAAKPVKRIDGQTRATFPADAALTDMVRTLDGVQVGGVGVSGQAYLNNAVLGACLFETLGARIVDMESAAVAQVADAHGVPFVAVRAVSDIVGAGYAQPVENFEQVDIAMQRAQNVVWGLLGARAVPVDEKH